MATIDLDSYYPAGARWATLALRACSCGAVLVVRDQVPIGLMDDGEGGVLVLFNCRACRTTLSEEVKP